MCVLVDVHWWDLGVITRHVCWDEENQNSIYAAIWKEYMQLLLNFPSSVKPTEIPYRLFAELKSVFC